jgi:hypothetical protein
MAKMASLKKIRRSSSLWPWSVSVISILGILRYLPKCLEEVFSEVAPSLQLPLQ